MSRQQHLHKELSCIFDDIHGEKAGRGGGGGGGGGGGAMYTKLLMSGLDGKIINVVCILTQSNLTITCPWM